MEAMVELGGEFAAGVCARTARAAKRRNWATTIARGMRFTTATYYAICEPAWKWKSSSNFIRCRRGQLETSLSSTGTLACVGFAIAVELSSPFERSTKPHSQEWL